MQLEHEANIEFGGDLSRDLTQTYRRELTSVHTRRYNFADMGKEALLELSSRCKEAGLTLTQEADYCIVALEENCAFPSWFEQFPYQRLDLIP